MQRGGWALCLELRIEKTVKSWLLYRHPYPYPYLYLYLFSYLYLYLICISTSRSTSTSILYLYLYLYLYLHLHRHLYLTAVQVPLWSPTPKLQTGCEYFYRPAYERKTEIMGEGPPTILWLFALDDMKLDWIVFNLPGVGELSQTQTTTHKESVQGFLGETSSLGLRQRPNRSPFF